ncbi:MAG: ABC transporter ATP-binding protein [Alphaproteobacteria bacterium]|nr:ABC transporter ATP-binding protein [Alphaproteobacteria bacterium]
MLEVQGLHTHYGRAEILADVSFAVGAGEVVALLGRNGAGKSTTLKSIMRLVRPTKGEVTFLGERISRLDPYQICRRGLGYVPEDRRIFTDLTVVENLEVARQAPRAGAPLWTLERLFHLFPNLAERRHRSARAMSGGEQQMLTVARTLMGNPRAILLDEPSEGLAPVIVEQMARAVQELKAEGVTIVLSEQNLHFAAVVADRAIIIEKGRIRYTGTMRAALADETVRATYLMV